MSNEETPEVDAVDVAALIAEMGAALSFERPVTPPPSGLTAEDTAKIRVTAYDGQGGVDHKTATAIALQGAKKWEDIPALTPEIRRAILEKGWIKPSKIQETALPLIITEKRNIIAQAQNGSGKTATFALGVVSSVNVEIKHPQAIVVSPTRELARQNLDVIEQLCKYNGISTQLVVPQTEGLPTRNEPMSAQIISATPGKLQQLLQKRLLNPKYVKFFVLDEADVMVSAENNMGSIVNSIRAMLPKDMQILLFSATYADRVQAFAHAMVPMAVKIEVSKDDLTLETIWQTYVDCGDDTEKKFQILSDLYAIMNIGQSIIFVNSRKLAMDVAQRMKKEGHAVSLFCGTQDSGPEKIDNSYRDRVIAEFRSGVTKVLVATDVLARGIDVPAVTLVVNYQLPTGKGGVDYETYLHRIGRTGRFGQRGVAINLVNSIEVENVKKVEAYYKGSVIEKIEADVDVLEKRMQEIQDNRSLYK